MFGVDRIRPVSCGEMAGGAVAASYALLCAEGAWARSHILAARLAALAADGVYGGGSGQPLTLVMMGDSLAAGIGADHPAQTPGALLAAGLARAAARPVRLHTVAHGGARTRDLPAQLDQAREAAPAAVVIVTGGNDVTHMLLPGRPDVIRPLRRVVAELVGAGAAVLVATCPDVSAVPAIPQPLRALTRRASKAVARAQAAAALTEGAHTVALGDTLGPVMRQRPGELFAADHFHPSAAAYAMAAQVMLPPLLAALRGCPARQLTLLAAAQLDQNAVAHTNAPAAQAADGRSGAGAEAAEDGLAGGANRAAGAVAGAFAPIEKPPRL